MFSYIELSSMGETSRQNGNLTLSFMNLTYYPQPTSYFMVK